MTIAPDLWSGVFTGDRVVRAIANQYLRWVGPGLLFVGLGLSLYFASQGSGKVLAPVLAGTVRLWVIVLGGWWLTASDASAWSLFALVAPSMTAYGLCSPSGDVSAQNYAYGRLDDRRSRVIMLLLLKRRALSRSSCVRQRSTRQPPPSTGGKGHCR